MKEANSDHYAILMAGGVGSRFWPVSTAKKPKQFRDLLGSGESLIQTTFKRLQRLVPKENIYILTNENYKELVREQLPELGQEQIFLEPARRNTAPAVLLAALKIYKKNKKAIMLMAPSDHWIADEIAFSSDIKLAFEACQEEERIITLGIQPDFPSTGFGYIKYVESPEKLKKVEEFVEKPSFERARAFLAEGNYLWNAGIFIWNISFIMEAFQRNLPEMYRLLSKGKEVLNTSEETRFIKEQYPKAENVSIDYGILEKENKIFVIPANFDWNDLGTWGSIYKEVEKDNNNNVILNTRALTEDASGTIIHSNSGKVVIVDGLKDYIIIDEEEVLLIVPKEKEQEIKEIRERAQKNFGQDIG